MRCDERDKLALNEFLGEIIAKTEEAKVKCLKAAGEATKNAVSQSVKCSNITDPDHVHIADDVQMSLVADTELGGKKAKIKGGKKTGTLWHIVNDGTYRSKATHFMDKAMQKVESEMDAIIEMSCRDIGG